MVITKAYYYSYPVYFSFYVLLDDAEHEDELSMPFFFFSWDVPEVQVVVFFLGTVFSV